MKSENPSPVRATRRGLPHPDLRTLRARDVMQTDLLVLGPDEGVRSAAEQLDEWNVTAAPVVDVEGHLVGVLSRSDIARGEHVDGDRVVVRRDRGDTSRAQALGEDEGYDEEYEPSASFGDAVEGRACVADWMTPSVVRVAPDTTLAEICHLLVTNDVHRVFVLEAERLVGVVSTKDIVRLLAVPPRARRR